MKLRDLRRSSEAELTTRLNEILVEDAREVHRRVTDALRRIRMSEGKDLDEFIVRTFGAIQSFVGLGVAAVPHGPLAILKLFAPIAILFKNPLLEKMFGG